MKTRKIACTGLKQAELTEVELQDKLEAYQIRVKAECSLISAGTETAIYTQTHIAYTKPELPDWLKPPVYLGYAMAGIVEDTGAEVTGVKKGDRVICAANHGDIGIVDVREAMVRKLPDNVTMEQGTLSRLASISMMSVRQPRVTLGETAVVIGLGLIGHLAAQLNLLAGARPAIGFDLIKERIDVANQNGITAFSSADVDAAEKVTELTDGAMAQVVIEATGNPKVIPMALSLAAREGRVALLGSPRGKTEIDAYGTVHNQGIALIGAHEELSPVCPTYKDPWSQERNVDTVLKLFDDGSLKSDGLISNRIKPEEAPEIYKNLAERPNDFMGVLIDWT